MAATSLEESTSVDWSHGRLSQSSTARVTSAVVWESLSWLFFSDPPFGGSGGQWVSRRETKGLCTWSRYRTLYWRPAIGTLLVSSACKARNEKLYYSRYQTMYWRPATGTLLGVVGLRGSRRFPERNSKKSLEVEAFCAS